MNRRFHAVTDHLRLHLQTSCGRFTKVVMDTQTKTLTAALGLNGSQMPVEVTFACTYDYMKDQETTDQVTVRAGENGTCQFNY